MKIDNIYESSDYAGCSIGKFSFYYGYEEVDKDDNWCFVAKVDGTEEFRMSSEELQSRMPEPEIYDNMLAYLMIGIVIFMVEKMILVTDISNLNMQPE